MNKKTFVLALPPPQLYEVQASSETDARLILMSEWYRQGMKPVVADNQSKGIVGFSTYDDLIRTNTLEELSSHIPYKPDFQKEEKL